MAKESKKLTAEELTLLQKLQQEFNGAKMNLGDTLLQQSKLMETVEVIKKKFGEQELILMEKYGKDAVINLETGEVKLNKKGEPTLSSYNVALNRIEDMYEKNDTNAPEWIQEARENQNPLDLTDRQEKDLFLANLYNRDAGGETDKLLKKIADGDKDAMMKLYMKYHHTNEDDKITRKRASEFYYNN